MPIVPIRVRTAGIGGYVDTYALLDSGANQTLCTEALADQLHTPKRRQKYILTTLGMEEVVHGYAVGLEVSDIEDESFHTLQNVLTRPEINVNLSNRANQAEIRGYSHLADINLQEVDDNRVQLIIGTDHPDVLLPQGVRKGQPGEPYAVRTTLGWTINGPIDHPIPGKLSVNSLSADTSLQRQVESFFRMEDLGGDIDDTKISLNDQQVLLVWNRDTKLVDGHYQTTIPF